MNIVFIHQNFPAQFKNIAPQLAKDNSNRVVSISFNPSNTQYENIESFFYPLNVSKKNQPHPLLAEEHYKILRAEGVLGIAKKLSSEGFQPDVIYVHPGWGESLFLRDVWPEAYIIGYFEYFYQAHGQDVDFDPEFPLTEQQRYLFRLKNNSNYQALETVDAGITPTDWQHSTYPEWAQGKISVIHEGINTDICKPSPKQQISLKKGTLTLTKKDQVITYIARNLEPLRGFHTFMRALPALAKKYPDAHFIIVGNDNISYGAKLPDGETYKQKLLHEVGYELDQNKVHFLGFVPYEYYVKILQITTVHFYATYPFVISWSLLEAMACGCAIVASKTAPVEEFIVDKQSGLLFDFFDQQSLISNISRLLEDKKLRKQLKKNARKLIKENYQLSPCIEGQKGFIHSNLAASKS